jgi:hypothetical protein
MVGIRSRPDNQGDIPSAHARTARMKAILQEWSGKTRNPQAQAAGFCGKSD